jgi:hypothetical protein
MNQKNQTKMRMNLEQLATEVKSLISRSSLDKIKIGELLLDYKKEIKYYGMKEFYKSIEMSNRTAQNYMKIAKNEEIQKLKDEGKLDGLNISKILELIGIRVDVEGAYNENAPQNQQVYTLLRFG